MPSTTMMMPNMQDCAFQRVAALAEEKLRHPDLNAAEGKRHRGHAERRGQECRIRRQPENRAALRSFLQRVELPSLGLLQKQNCDCQQKTRHCGDIKRKTPAVSAAPDIRPADSPPRIPQESPDKRRPESVRVYSQRNRSATNVGAMVTNVASPTPTSVCRIRSSV